MGSKMIIHTDSHLEFDRFMILNTFFFIWILLLSFSFDYANICVSRNWGK